MGVGGADEHVALAEPVPGARGRLGDQAARGREQVDRDERQLALAAAQHQRRRLQPGLHAGADPVGAGPAAERVAGRRGDVGAPDAGRERGGLAFAAAAGAPSASARAARARVRRPPGDTARQRRAAPAGAGRPGDEPLRRRGARRAPGLYGRSASLRARRPARRGRPPPRPRSAPRARASRLLGVLGGSGGVFLGLGGVLLGLAAVTLGVAAALARPGDVRVGLLAMRERLVGEPLLLDLALGRAAAGHGDSRPTTISAAITMTTIRTVDMGPGYPLRRAPIAAAGAAERVRAPSRRPRDRRCRAAAPRRCRRRGLR